jgi:cytochrome c
MSEGSHRVVGRLRNSLLAAAVLAFLPGVALAQSPAETGQALLQEHCSGCHAIGKTGDSPRTGAPPFRTLARSYDLDEFPRKLRSGVIGGHPDMPEFRFKEDDARAAGVYLRSIQE